MDRFEAMHLLRLVVDKGSFTAAAKAARMPLPTVSRKIGELEAHLGTRLLTRSTRRLAVTDAGLAYLDAARRILDDIDEAERSAAGEYLTPRGDLVVTAPILFGRLHILPIITDFLAAYPDIDVRFLLSDRNLHLIDDHVDLGIRIGRMPDSLMVATRVGAMRTVLCGAPQLIAAHGSPQRPADLAVYPTVSFDLALQAAATTWGFRDAATHDRIEVSITPRLSATTAEVAVAAAVRGTGLTRVYHYQAAAAVQAGALQILLPDFEPEPDPVQLIHAGRDKLPLKTRVFLDFTAGRLRSELTKS